MSSSVSRVGLTHNIFHPLVRIEIDVFLVRRPIVWREAPSQKMRVRCKARVLLLDAIPQGWWSIKSQVSLALLCHFEPVRNDNAAPINVSLWPNLLLVTVSSTREAFNRVSAESHIKKASAPLTLHIQARLQARGWVTFKRESYGLCFAEHELWPAALVSVS